MDIRDQLLVEHSKQNTLAIAGYIGNNSERFSVLMDLFFNDPNKSRVVQRAAHVLSFCLDKHPDLITPHLEALIHNLKEDNVHVAVRRNTVRALQTITIPEELLGDTWNICFTYLSSAEEPIAVKAFSMTVLYNICKKLPELKEELQIVIEDQLPYGSSGFKNRAHKVLKGLTKL